MRARGPHPLFHAIVSMGAALSSSGCGGVQVGSTGSSDPSGGGAATTDGGVSFSGSAGTTFVGPGGAPPFAAGGFGSGGTPDLGSGGTGNGGRPPTPPDGGVCPPGTAWDCIDAKRCVCSGANVTAADCAGPAQFTCGNFVCWCDPDAPPTPKDCPNTAQFGCQEWSPVPTGCSCNSNAPTDASQCGSCGKFACQSYAPPVGCFCVICIR